MKQRKNGRKAGRGWGLAPILALALIVGLSAACGSRVFAADKKKKAADTKDLAYYTVEVETFLTKATEDPDKTEKVYGVEVYVKGEVTGNPKVLDESSKEVEWTVDQVESGYMRLKSGYQVPKDSLIMVKQTLPGSSGIEPSGVYFYSYAGGEYAPLEFKNGKTGDLPAKSNMKFGTDWKYTSIAASYTGGKLNEDNEILAGTELSTADFTVEVVRAADNKIVTLPKEEYKLSVTTIPSDGTSEIGIMVSYLKNTGLYASVPFDITTKKLTKIDAICNQKYYIGDTIYKKDVTVHAYYADVTKPGASETSKKLDASDFEISKEIADIAGTDSITVTYRGMQATVEIGVTGVRQITAEYTGKDVVVNNKFDQSKVKVSLVYDDGETKKLDQKKDNYVFTIEVVTKVGDNEIGVVYNGYTAVFYVTGVARAVTKITAAYTGEEIIVGNSFNSADVKVTAYFNDGSEEVVTDFLLSTTMVTQAGANKVTVTYKDKTTTVNVPGRERKATSIVAIYTGDVVVAGSTINRNDVSVTAYFEDGTYANVTDFSLSMETLNGVGMNTITVTYKDAIATIYVVCIAREATALEATYRGPDIEQLSSFSRDNVLVTATFNDGTSEQVTDFILVSTIVSELGTNYYQVNYGSQSATFTVYGVARVITGTGTQEVGISNDKYDTTFTAIVDGKQIRENMSVSIEAYEQADLKKIVRKTSKKGKYFGFEVDLEGYEFADNQYMTARITVPDGFDPARVAMFYTPDRKAVMAQLGGGLINADTYEFYVYRSGTYVLLECEKETWKSADLRNVASENIFLFASGVKSTMKVGDSVTLVPHLVNSASTDETVFWSVDDASVATITSEGRLTAKSSGYVTVKLKTKDGKYTCEYEINVEEE